MGWSEPPISGEVWDNVVRGKFPLIDSEIVRAYATGYGSFHSVVDETASEANAVARICRESFGGLLLTAPEEKYTKLGGDGTDLATRAETWAGRLNRVADLIDEAQQKIVWTVLVVAQQVAQLTGRNRDRNEIAVQLQALYDEGYKQVAGIYDALYENPDLSAPDDAEAPDDGSGSEGGWSTDGGSPAVAKTPPAAVVAPKPADSTEEGYGTDDGSLAAAKTQPQPEEQPKPTGQEQAVAQQPQSATPTAQSSTHQGESHAASQGAPAPAATTHVASAALVDRAAPPSAHTAPTQQQQPADRPGFFTPAATVSRPSQPQQRSSQTAAQSGAQAPAQSRPAQEQQNHDEGHLVGHDQAQQQQTAWSDSSAATSAMGAAALAPSPAAGHMGWSAPIASLESRTGFSASGFGYQAEGGHTLGANGVLGSTGGNEAYLAWAQSVVGAASASARLGGTEVAGVAYYHPDAGQNGLALALCSNLGCSYLPFGTKVSASARVMFAPGGLFHTEFLCYPCAAQTASLWFGDLDQTTPTGGERPRLLALFSSGLIPPELVEWARAWGGVALPASPGAWDARRLGQASPDRLAAIAPQLRHSLRVFNEKEGAKLGWELACWAARATRLDNEDVGALLRKNPKRLGTDGVHAFGQAAARFEHSWFGRVAQLPPAGVDPARRGWDDQSAPGSSGKLLDQPVPHEVSTDYAKARAATALRVAVEAPGHPDALADVVYEVGHATLDWRGVQNRVQARLT